MPKKTTTTVTDDRALHDTTTGEFLTAYASGAPFRLSLSWSDAAGNNVNREVTPDDAAELLLQPANEHLAEKGYAVTYNTQTLGTKVEYSDVRFMLLPEARKTVTFEEVKAETHFYTKTPHINQQMYPEKTKWYKTANGSAVQYIQSMPSYESFSSTMQVWVR
jgi:hypothetical protein